MNGNDFVERIKSELRKRDIRINRLSNDLNISKGSVSNWEKRGNIPSAETVYQIAKYLNVSMEYLLTGETEETEPVQENETILNDSDSIDINITISFKRGEK